MKLTIAKDQILNGLQAVQNIIGTRTTLPVLSNVLISGGETGLDLTATDLDVTISAKVEAVVEQAGSTTVPAKKIFGIMRELPAQEVEMETDDKHGLIVKSGGCFFRVNGLAPEEFPPITQPAEEKRVLLPQAKIKSMLRKTSYAISNDEARYVLNGIYFSIKDQKISMVATDGRRLALAEEDIDVPAEGQSEFIVPAKAIGELNRLLQTAGDVEIRLGGNQVAFRLQSEQKTSALLISKLIDGSYPNFRQVIPAESKEHITLVREELLQALRRAEIMTSDKANSVKLNFSRNNLAIMANSPDVGEARESLAINYKGRDLAVAFNPGFMMDPLKALDNDEIILELSDELSPAVMKINGPFLYVIMPMRTN